MDCLPCKNFPIRVNQNGCDMESKASFKIFRPGSPLKDANGKRMWADDGGIRAAFGKSDAKDFFRDEDEGAALPAAPPPIWGLTCSPRRLSSLEKSRCFSEQDDKLSKNGIKSNIG